MNEKEMYDKFDIEGSRLYQYYLIVKKAAEPEYSVKRSESSIYVPKIYVKKYSDRLGKDVPLLSIYWSETRKRWLIRFGDFGGTKADFDIPEDIEQDFIREFIIGADKYYKANQATIEAKAELSKLVRNPKEYIRNTKLNNLGI